VPGDAINPQRPIAADANTLISLLLLGAQRTDMADLTAGLGPVANDPNADFGCAAWSPPVQSEQFGSAAAE